MLIRQLLLGSLLLLSVELHSQNSFHPTGISIGLAALRYMPPPAAGKSLPAGSYRPGLVLSFNRSLSGAFDFRTQLAGGMNMDNPAWESGAVQGGWMLDMSYQLAFRPLNGWILRREARISPYLIGGIGGSYQPGAPDAYVPLGAGLRIQPSPRFHLLAEGTRKLSLNEDYQHLAYVLAFVYNIGQSQAERMLEPELRPEAAASDRDQDGIADAQDDCPDEAGTPAMLGCPGASDSPPEFLHPEIRPLAPAEIAALRIQDLGAPAPVPSPIPLPQSVDYQYSGASADVDMAEPAQEEEEALPPLLLPETEAPSPEPEAPEEAAPSWDCHAAALSEARPQSVYFAQGSERLSPDAQEQLSHVAALLLSCPTLRLVLEGHTDDSGSARDNLVLSILRAYNVKYYLVYQYGISQSRISSRGLGEQQPSGDNRSASGAQQNRRVELILTH